MTAQEILDKARDSMTVARVFGEPYEKNGVTILPAAKIAGGAGGGDGEGRDGHGAGSGGGFGLREHPAGAFVIRGEHVRWVPSIDVNRIILGGQIVAIVAILASVLRQRRTLAAQTEAQQRASACRPLFRALRRARSQS